MMETMRICAGCKKPIAPDAPQGLCPECLLKAGLGSGVDIGPDGQSQAESGKARFVAPTPDELVKPFPQLEILGFIGQGGMGAVYKARQKALERIVALKILPPGIGKDPAFAERFAHEAKALAKLNHPGIVTLYEFGQADGLFFFLMEFVDGVNLRQLLEAGRLSPREALAIVPQICDALQYAHDQGIVHRDIKPENILLDRQGRVKVADFGLAKLVGVEGEPSAAAGRAPGSVVLTETGTVMGTPQYMAPEQREHPAEVDHRADIYSLGVVFYQMLTGELPGKRIEPPSRRVQLDVRIDEIVMRALEKTPELRYQTAADFRTQIETVVNDTGTARPAIRPDNPAPPLLNVGTSLVTTPEQLGTFDGQFFLYRRKSQMLLEDRQLTFARAGTTTVIPLAAIRDLSIGHYPRVMHPMGIDFISVTYDDGGQTKCFFFSPYESWFGLPSSFNRFVAEWFNAIRAAVVAATGREPGSTPAEQLGVPPGSKGSYALILLPMAMAITLLSFLLVGRRTGEAAIHSFFSVPLVIVLAIGVIILSGFLAPVFGRFFGSGRKKEVETTASMAGKLPKGFGQRPKGIVLVGRRGERRKIHWPGLMNVFMVVVALGVLGQTLFGVLIGWSLEAGMMLLSSLLVSAVFLVGMVVRSMALPLDSLTNLDEPPAPMAVETIAAVHRVGFWRARIVIVGVRDGRRVIHWPGVVLIAALFVAMTVAVSLIVYWLVPLKGYAPLSNGLIAGYVVGCGLLAIKLYRAWTTPIEKLPRLNG